MIVADAEAIGGERAKILDFGIAKAQSATEASEATSVKTQTGALMGTPRYMSPEQCRGRGEITGKSDVYSLGVMLYEMVGGRSPMIAEASGELIAMHIYLVPTPLREVDPSLPGELTQLVDAMLAKNPDDRPTMLDVVKQLEQLGANRSIPPPSELSAGSFVGTEKALQVSPSWPDVVAGMLATPTTLRAAAAKGAPEQPVPRRPVNPLLVLAIGAVGIAAMVSLQLVRRPALMPAPVTSAAAPGAGDGVDVTAHAAPLPPAMVHWKITSQPPGAQVVRASDQQVLGSTPWQTELAVGAQRVQLVLRLPGYGEKSLELSQSTDADRTEELRPTTPSAPAPRSRVKRRGSARPAPAGKSSSEEISDDELRIVK